jgi:hypothetical protein
MMPPPGQAPGFLVFGASRTVRGPGCTRLFAVTVDRPAARVSFGPGPPSFGQREGQLPVPPLDSSCAVTRRFLRFTPLRSTGPPLSADGPSRRRGGRHGRPATPRPASASPSTESGASGPGPPPPSSSPAPPPPAAATPPGPMRCTAGSTTHTPRGRPGAHSTRVASPGPAGRLATDR